MLERWEGAPSDPLLTYVAEREGFEPSREL